MKYHRLFLFFFVIVMCFVKSRDVFAVRDCGPNDAIECWNQRASELQSELEKNRGLQQTLASTVSYLDKKLQLSEVEIKKTQLEIATLEKEIDELSVRIDGLELSLQRLTELLLENIQESSKHRVQNPLFLLFSSRGFSDFLRRYKYAQMAQEETHRMMREAESQKIVYGEEKATKEKKQAEVLALKKKLETQRTSLRDQQQQKKALLTVTKNDEKKYQELLAEARSQIEKFKTYVASQGGASLLDNQTHCDGWGCYYNQRDAQWGRKFMGWSSEPMAESGCLVTSMAMVASHYGRGLTPGTIADSPAPFYGSTPLMIQGSWTVNGVTMTRTRVGFSTSRIDEEIRAGRPVIIGLFSSPLPGHFIVIKGKNDQGYIMNDPFLEHGYDKPFLEKYKLSDMRTLDIVR